MYTSSQYINIISINQKLMCTTEFQTILVYLDGGIAPFILKPPRQTDMSSLHRRLTRAASVPCSPPATSQATSVICPKQTREYASHIRAFQCCHHKAHTASQLPTHETECTVVWASLLTCLHEQYRKVNYK